MVADVVRSMPKERRGAVLDRFAAVHTALNASALAKTELRDAAVDTVNETALQFFELGVPCPFLEDESCSIHPQRPSVCREYLVTSPASDCVQLRTNKSRRIPTAMRVSEALSQLTAKLLERDTIEIVPLHMALHWAEENADDDKRTWPAPTLMQKFFEAAQAAQLGL
jgi:Fe-S-cluster containining protein